MSKIGLIRTLVRDGLYYLTEHALEEAEVDGFDIYDVEHGILTSHMRHTWAREGKFELIGEAMDGRTIGIVCRVTLGGKVRVITVYEDQPL